MAEYSADPLGFPAQVFSAFDFAEPYRSGTEVRLASAADDLDQIYQFRYRVYVEQMDLRQHYADHVRRRIEDPLDHNSANFAAFSGGEIVGAVRVNFPRCSDIGYYERLFRMASVGPFHPSATSICTRLLVAPRLRGTTLALRLCKAAYVHGLYHRIRYNFVDCDDRLIPFFSRLGYTRLHRAEHPEYGVGTVMRLDLLNSAALAHTRSPLLPLLEQADLDESAAPYPLARGLAQGYIQPTV